jgi:hypothetical protein
MRFRLNSAWPLFDGTWIVPADTIIDTSANDQWSVRARGQTIPFSAQPLDQEAWEAQLAAYPDAKHLLGGGWQ